MAQRSSTQIRKGNDLMVFMDGSALAFATNHTLTVNTETEEVQSKDSGYNGIVIPKRLTWEITSENMYIDGEYDKLMTAMQTQEAVNLKWGVPSGDTSEKITADGKPFDKATTPWSAPTAGYYEGDAFITSLVVNAAAGENATYSITFQGSGDFKKKVS